jgi:two-component system, chemotaxis family, protein-glutamate methylesterase/glutaminase
MSERVRVLVVDDSALMRKMIPQILSRDPQIEVVGTAMDGAFGLKKIAELRPHVVTLDLNMPRMDGVEMLRAITGKHHVPVIIVTSQTEESARTALKALALGAFDFVAKPVDAASGRIEAIAEELALKIKVAATTGAPKLILTVTTEKRKATRAIAGRPFPSRVAALGVSTGGPAALQYLFAQLPEDFPGCLLVVQHMPENFTNMFAKRLDESCAIEVKEARSGDLLLAGRALICPGNHHMKVKHMPHGDVVVLDDMPPVNGHRPSVDVLFRSMAREFGKSSLGVIMTGMGEDGVAGLGEIQAAGGITLAQSSDSCVVDSMPRSAVERGFADKVVSLSSLAGVLLAHCANEKISTELASVGPSSGLTDAERISRRR